MSQSEKQRQPFSKNTAKLYSNQPETIQVETLYNTHYERVRAFLISRSVGEEVVEEVLQDLYLKLMAVDDLSMINNPASYLVRMAQNLLTDAMRRQGRNDKRTVPESVETLDIADLKPSLFDQALSVQRLTVCEQALAELPPAWREILLLSRLEGLTHGQIAEKYGRSTSWVEKTIVRTVAHCRRKLAQFDQQ